MTRETPPFHHFRLRRRCPRAPNHLTGLPCSFRPALERHVELLNSFPRAPRIPSPQGPKTHNIFTRARVSYMPACYNSSTNLKTITKPGVCIRLTRVISSRSLLRAFMGSTHDLDDATPATPSMAPTTRSIISSLVLVQHPTESVARLGVPFSRSSATTTDIEARMEKQTHTHTSSFYVLCFHVELSSPGTGIRARRLPELSFILFSLVMHDSFIAPSVQLNKNRKQRRTIKCGRVESTISPTTSFSTPRTDF